MIRDARPGDLPALLAVQSELSRPNPDLLRVAVEGVGVVLVSTDGDRPVGYVLLVPGGDAAYLAEIAVHPEHRREGRASGLLDAATERAADAGCERVTLAVSPENDGARACYENAGFAVQERDETYYDGDPALLMTRECSDENGGGES